MVGGMVRRRVRGGVEIGEGWGGGGGCEAKSARWRWDGWRRVGGGGEEDVARVVGKKMEMASVKSERWGVDGRRRVGVVVVRPAPANCGGTERG